MNADKMHNEKAEWQLRKNVTGYIEQILEATYDESTDVQPLTSHLKKHPSKTNRTCGILLEKQSHS